MLRVHEEAGNTWASGLGSGWVDSRTVGVGGAQEQQGKGPSVPWGLPMSKLHPGC